MKQYNIYQCEFCGTRYKSEKDCKKCEEYHIEPVGVFRYTYSSSKDKYPTGVTLSFDKNETILYVTTLRNKLNVFSRWGE